FWPSGLFAITMLAHISITGYALFRSRQRAAVPKEEKDQFKSMPSERGATPEAMNLDPRAEAES
ncbi:hypothetical protein, partial [Enterobacter cloacae]